VPHSPVPDDGTLELPVPEERYQQAAAEHLARLDLPGAGLGSLAGFVAAAGAAQGTAVPRPWGQVRTLLLHGHHHGGAATGDDLAATGRRIAAVRNGEGPLALLAARAGSGVHVVACPDSAAMEEQDALSAEAVERCLAHGWGLAETAADEGVDALILATASVGAQAAAAAVTALVTGAEPAGLLDRVAGADGRVDDDAWISRCATVRDGLHRVRSRQHNPRSILSGVGGGDLGVAVGLVLGAASRRTPVLLDGPVGMAAALVARDIAPAVRHWLIVADHGGHPLVRFGADLLALTPPLHLRLRLGEGATSLAALPLLGAALAIARNVPEAPR
jgi:NaMN:DMB phosphoribosyltransferase